MLAGAEAREGAARLGAVNYELYMAEAIAEAAGRGGDPIGAVAV
jgi:hypothetical protein